MKHLYYIAALAATFLTAMPLHAQEEAENDATQQQQTRRRSPQASRGERNDKKDSILYNFLDNSKLFKGTVVPEDRSLMNVPFVIGDDELEKKFIAEAEANGFVNLKGHRTVGGMRASIYNAMPIEGVEKLVEFMAKFEEENK